MTDPYLSVVVTSRNDNHGGDLNLRTQTFINALSELCQRHRLSIELLFIEWNPPLDRPPLAEVLQWPDSGGYCQYRIVTVPPEVHRRYHVADQLHLFQMIGKNVGIRRARGAFILATNIDLVFSDELVAWLARRELEEGYYYRVDRHDVPAGIMRVHGLADQLAFCRDNVLRVHVRSGLIRGARWRRMQRGLSLATAFQAVRLSAKLLLRRLRKFSHRGVSALGRLLVTRPRAIVTQLCVTATQLCVLVARPRLMVALIRRTVRRPRFIVTLIRRIVARPRLIARLIVAQLGLIVARLRRIVRVIITRLRLIASLSGRAIKEFCAGSNWRTLSWAEARRNRSRFVQHWRRLHTNACGDFTLMSKRNWESLRGYAEFEMYSWHIDSAAVHAAFHSGMAERVIPHPVYHIEHSGGWSPESDKGLFERLRAKGIPFLSNEDLSAIAEQLSRARGEFRFNDERWGLALHNLCEIPRSVVRYRATNRSNTEHRNVA